MENQKSPRIIISGGGTGGHIFPALAIAKTILKQYPNAAILFVGAEGKMEMEKVPQAGFQIIGLPIVGIQRRLTLKNFLVPIKVLQSLRKARTIIREFQPDVAVGVGGYASGPLLLAAASMGIPTVIQEQNSYPGITNKLLALKAKRICVAYEGLEKWFPKEKIVVTGNPVREEMISLHGKRETAMKHFELNPSKKTVLVVGGSLGARTINEAVREASASWSDSDVQVLWQTGNFFFPAAKEVATHFKNMHAHAFIKEMDLAYAAADLIVSRAGAMSISELCLVGKPAIFVPSPNVSEDHQTKNAMALVSKGAAWMIKDSEAKSQLGQKVIDLLESNHECMKLANAIKGMAKLDAANQIASWVISESLKNGSF